MQKVDKVKEFLRRLGKTRPWFNGFDARIDAGGSMLEAG